MKPPRPFAQGTTVPVVRARSELEALVLRHGAKAFMSAFTADRHTLMFELRGRRLRFDVVAPDRRKHQFCTVPRWEAEERRRWRALLLVIKVKLEVVASGDADFDVEFLPYFTIADGMTTVAARLIPELDRVLSGGEMPPLLPTAGNP